MTQQYPQDNILIKQDGRACLVDFGLSTIVGADASLDPLDPNLLDVNPRDSLMSFIEGGSHPWTSPELLDSNTGNYRPTKESDVYAMGMVIYEVRMFVPLSPWRWTQHRCIGAGFMWHCSLW